MKEPADHKHASRHYHRMMPSERQHEAWYQYPPFPPISQSTEESGRGRSGLETVDTIGISGKRTEINYKSIKIIPREQLPASHGYKDEIESAYGEIERLHPPLIADHHMQQVVIKHIRARPPETEHSALELLIDPHIKHRVPEIRSQRPESQEERKNRHRTDQLP